MKKIHHKEKKNGIKKKRKFFEKKTDGFTYVETIAVLAIGAILSAGTIASAAKIVAMARRTAAKSDIYQFSTALQTYFLDCGRYPTTEQGIEALWKKPDMYPIPEKWNGPYLEREPSADPWGTNYKYYSRESSVMPTEVPENLPYVLMSFGADCKEGGEGEGEDIVSWK